MLPHKHFLIAALFTYFAGISLFSELLLHKMLIWALIAGITSSLVDLDLYSILLFRSGKEKNLRPFKNPLRIYKQYEMLEKAMIEGGFIKTGLKTHLISSAMIATLSFYLLNSFFTPIVLGLVSHLLSDVIYTSKTLIEKRDAQELE